MKRILSVAVALVMVLALSVCVFAAETGTYSVTVTEADNWWHETFFSEFLDFNKVAEYDTLTIAVDGVNLVLGYNGAGGGWVQGEATPDVVTLNIADCIFDENSKVALSTAAGDYTLTWTLSKAGEEVTTSEPEDTAAAAAETADAAEADAPADTAAADTAPAPSTGIALAVVPAIIALGAAAISKKR